MALKNYTSTISAGRSIAHIEVKLAQHGATQILKRYDDQQRVSGICFTIPVKGQEFSFKLPAKVSECEKVLRANRSSRARPETLQRVGQQAERTAWKILSDWVDAQMAMIELAQIEVLEVFMPYVLNPQTEQTFFETVKENNYKPLLLPGSK